MRTVQTAVITAAVCLLSAFFCVFGAFDSYAYETMNALIPVSLSEDSAGEQVYTIMLEAETAGVPMPESVSLSLANEESGFFEIPLTEPGTYNYLVYELEGGDELIDYDTRVYGVTLFVEDNGEGALVYTVVANANDSAAKSEQIEFRNNVLGEKDEHTQVPSEVTTTALSEAATTETVTTAVETTTAAVTTTEKKSSVNTIQEFFGAVMTGDTFPAHTVRIIMLAAIAAAVIAFLFKRRSSEEEEE